MSDLGTEEKSESTLQDDLQALLKEIRSHSRRFSRTKNLLKTVANKELDAADFEAWLHVHRGLDGIELGHDTMDALRQKVVGRLEGELNRLGMKARMKFLTKLNILAGQEQVEVEKISEAPLVLHLKPLTMEIDFDEGGARMLYGHEVIEEKLAIDAAKLLRARQNALQEMRKESMESEAFFDLLLHAYRTVVVSEKGEEGARVDLVDVLVPLSMLRVKKKELRKKGPAAMKPFARHLLAWQLARLRRDGLLERNGLRLELGAATGGSTRDKRDVLYIPVGASSGQYYGSIKFERRSE